MEIGSFIELQMPKGKEYYSEKENIARLNTGRAAIYHAFRQMNCDTLWLPYYQCDTVRDFLMRKGVPLKYYHIDKEFNPINLGPGSREAVLFVNYYGIMSNTRMKNLANGYENVIIDNSQAFFSEPLDNAMNVYSARKFVGVPDGAYVVGRGADRYVSEYEQCFSSDTALFLLKRIERGCEGEVYQDRMRNEHRIDTEDIMKMSMLTRYILDGTDYDLIKTKRKQNFKTACDMFGGINCLDASMYYDESCVPMVYPLVIEDDATLEIFLKAKHFQGHWWSYLLDEVPNDSYEYWLSRYVIPITIDQRYGKNELEFLRGLIT